VEHSLDGAGDCGWCVCFELMVRCWERFEGPQSISCRGSHACENDEAAKRDGDGSVGEEDGASMVAGASWSTGREICVLSGQRQGGRLS
jgi:hypothetical protein